MGKGGGNDGGVVATKRYLIKTKDAEYKNKRGQDDSTLVARMSTCAVSGEPLKEPVVCDELGSLFNKEAVLALLLERASASRSAAVSPAFAHIKSIKKDVISVTATPNPAYKGDNNVAAFVCPVSMIEANGKQPFLVVRACGCMVSERAVKAMSNEVCPSCNAPLARRPAASATAGSSASAASSSLQDAFIKLCPSEDELVIIRARLQQRKADAASAASSKRDAKATASAESSSSASASGPATTSTAEAGTGSSASSGSAVGQKRQREDTSGSNSGTDHAHQAGQRQTSHAASNTSSTAHSRGPSRHHPSALLAAAASSSAGPRNHQQHHHDQHQRTSRGPTSTAAEVDAHIAANKSKSSVYNKLFHSSNANGGQSAATGNGSTGRSTGGLTSKGAFKSADDLFMRTSTNVFAQPRSY